MSWVKVKCISCEKVVDGKINQLFCTSKCRKEMPEHAAWTSMKSRTGKNVGHHYAYYKSKGISYCEEWNNFSNFFHDMGRKPTGLHTLDRIDNAKGYNKDNCRWATRKEQSVNRDHCIKCVVNNINFPTLKAACQYFNVNYSRTIQRIKRNRFSIEEAINKEEINPGKNQVRKDGKWAKQHGISK